MNIGKKTNINKWKDLLKKFNTIYNGKYDYSKSVYNGERIPIIIKCPLHGFFESSPRVHRRGKGCLKCIFKNYSPTKEKLIEKFKLKHGEKYDYSKVEYTDKRAKVEIICNIHGSFFQRYDMHIYGQGCPKCVDRSNLFKKENWIKQAKDRYGIFYILKCYNETEEFFKFGITCNSIKQRYNHIKGMPYNYEIIKEITSKNLNYIWELERKFKRIKIKQRYTPLLSFKGSATECFKS